MSQAATMLCPTYSSLMPAKMLMAFVRYIDSNTM